MTTKAYDKELLSVIARRYSIFKGDSEPEEEWKARLIYSICGMMAYASLLDISPDDSEKKSVSIEHVKERTCRTLTDYITIYPETAPLLPDNPEQVAEEIEDQFINSGIVYHSSQRLTPAMLHEKSFGGILFQRGISPDDISCISGLGFYSKKQHPESLSEIQSMFGLEPESLASLWDIVLSFFEQNKAVLPPADRKNQAEYLRLNPPFSAGHWIKSPETKTVSLFRNGHLYYLYCFNNGIMEYCQLPEWRIENYRYRNLADACLFNHGTLPPIEYFPDGQLIHVKLNYLLPPRELALLKLYSWPESLTSFPCNFHRKLSKAVFGALKNILSAKGYQFKEGKNL